METLKKLFGSRRFVLAVFALVVQVIIANVPTLATRADLIGQIAIVVVAAILGISLQKSVEAWAGRPATPEAAVQDVVYEVLHDFFGTGEDGGSVDAEGNPIKVDAGGNPV